MASGGHPAAAAVGGLLFAALLAAPAGAAVHALVVGINAYDGPPKLLGAVNDAHDVSAALKTSGAGIVTTLLDGAATRERVFAEWQSLVANSASGDLLVFHFAGHGINEPDTDGDEADGLDEAYLLAGFDEERNPSERLIDDEIDQWLAQAGAVGRKVLFIADACHSGSPTRSVFGATLPTRFYRPRTQPERPRPLLAAVAEAGSRDFIFSVGATLDNRTVPEIPINDTPRGALSFAVARALEGGADLDGDGTLLASEFEAFVRQNVRQLAASKQTPQFDFPDQNLPILSDVSRVIAVVPADETAGSSVRIHVRPGADQGLHNAIAGLADVALVDDEAAAQLVFDPATGALANTMRDIVAEDLDLDGLKTAIEADRTLRELQTLALGGTLPIAFSPNDEIHVEGTRIGFTVPGVGGSYLTVFDLTATGSVHFLWPTDSRDADPIPEGEAFTLDAAVTPPFGADNLVVLATDAPPSALRAELKRLDGGHDPAALLAGLKDALAGQVYRIGVQAFFTRRK